MEKCKVCGKIKYRMVDGFGVYGRICKNCGEEYLQSIAEEPEIFNKSTKDVTWRMD